MKRAKKVSSASIYKIHLTELARVTNAQLTGKKLLVKISERSEQKANCFLSMFNFLLCLPCSNLPKYVEYTSTYHCNIKQKNQPTFNRTKYNILRCKNLKVIFYK